MEGDLTFCEIYYCDNVVYHDIVCVQCIVILEWTTSLDSSSGSLICDSLCPCHVGRNTYHSGLEFDGGTAAICRRALATGRNAL